MSQEETSEETVHGVPIEDQVANELAEARKEAEAQEELSSSEGQEGSDVSPQEGQDDKKPGKLSSAYEEIARRDRELRQKQQEIKQYKDSVGELEKIRELSKSDPAAAAKALGIDPWKLIENSLSEGKEEPEEKTPQELLQIKQELEELRQQQQVAQHQSLVNAEHGKIRANIEAMAKDAPVVALLAEDGGEIVSEIMEAARIRYEETGELPRYADLINNAEAVLTDQYKTQIERLAKLDKFGGLFGGRKPDAEPQRHIQAKAIAKTLTNDMSSESPGREDRPLTREEVEADVLRDLKQNLWVEENQ